MGPSQLQTKVVPAVKPRFSPSQKHRGVRRAPEHGSPSSAELPAQLGCPRVCSFQSQLEKCKPRGSGRDEEHPGRAGNTAQSRRNPVRGESKGQCPEQAAACKWPIPDSNSPLQEEDLLSE